MKSLKVIGKNVLENIFPKIVKPGFENNIRFFDHTLDINRRVNNLYSNISQKFRDEHANLRPNGIAIKFAVWGMTLGMVPIRLAIVAENNSSNNRLLKKELIELISNCSRIRRTRYAPTHVIVTITAEGKNWEYRQHEIYYLEKFQSEEILNNSGK